MKFTILSEREIKKYQSNEKHVVISITSPEAKFVKLPDNPNRLGILMLKFPDLDREIERYKYNNLLFNKYNAQAILNFFNLHIGQIELVIVQCEAGISRSPAVAAALSKAIGQDDSYFFKHYIPNRLVYRTILKEANSGQ